VDDELRTAQQGIKGTKTTIDVLTNPLLQKAVTYGINAAGRAAPIISSVASSAAPVVTTALRALPGIGQAATIASAGVRIGQAAREGHAKIEAELARKADPRTYGAWVSEDLARRARTPNSQLSKPDRMRKGRREKILRNLQAEGKDYSSLEKKDKGFFNALAETGKTASNITFGTHFH
jgi:hypothetical protein